MQSVSDKRLSQTLSEASLSVGALCGIQVVGRSLMEISCPFKRDRAKPLNGKQEKNTCLHLFRNVHVNFTVRALYFVEQASD